MSDDDVVVELVTFFRTILEDPVKRQPDETLSANLKGLVKDLSVWTDLFAICPNCNHLFLLCPWCENLISNYNEFREHGFACLGADK